MQGCHSRFQLETQCLSFQTSAGHHKIHVSLDDEQFDMLGHHVMT